MSDEIETLVRDLIAKARAEGRREGPALTVTEVKDAIAAIESAIWRTIQQHQQGIVQ